MHILIYIYKYICINIHIIHININIQTYIMYIHMYTCINTYIHQKIIKYSWCTNADLKIVLYIQIHITLIP